MIGRKSRSERGKEDQCVHEDLHVYIYLVSLFQKDGAFCCLHTYAFSIVAVNAYHHFLRDDSEFRITVSLISTISPVPMCPHWLMAYKISVALSYREQSGKATSVLLSDPSQFLNDEGMT